MKPARSLIWCAFLLAAGFCLVVAILIDRKGKNHVRNHRH